MRKYYLDNIRWATVVLVVLYHIIYMYNGVQPFGVIGAFYAVQLQDAYQYFVYPWFMVLLFVVSGMSARFELGKRTTKQFIGAKTRKLLVPSTLGLFVFWWIQGYFNMAIGGAFETMALPTEIPLGVRSVIYWLIMSVSGIGPLWYIQMLWFFSLLLTVIRKIEGDRLYNVCGRVGIVILILLTGVLYLAAQVLNTPIITVYRFGIYGFCYFMGYFVFSHDEVIDRIVRFRLPLLIVGLCLGIIYTVRFFGENYAVEPVINHHLACIYAWIMILAILGCSKAWFDKSTAFTQWMGRKSWGLYLFHYLGLSIAALLLKQYAPNTPAILCYIIVGIAAFAGGWLMPEIIRRIPVLRWFAMGIRKEKHVSR